MNITLITSLIALVGVALSAIISILIANRTAKNEIRKIRYEIQHSKAEVIHEERVKKYPQAYRIINKLNLSIKHRTYDIESINKLYDEFLEWYQQNGLFLSSKSNSLTWELLNRLNKLGNNEDYLVNKLKNHDSRRKFIGQLDKVELELKNDLGIFEIEYFNPDARFTSYGELMEHYRKKEKEIGDE